jgi:hypothetical protein
MENKLPFPHGVQRKPHNVNIFLYFCFVFLCMIVLALLVYDI